MNMKKSFVLLIIFEMIKLITALNIDMIRVYGKKRLHRSIVYQLAESHTCPHLAYFKQDKEETEDIINIYFKNREKRVDELIVHDNMGSEEVKMYNYVLTNIWEQCGEVSILE